STRYSPEVSHHQQLFGPSHSPCCMQRLLRLISGPMKAAFPATGPICVTGGSGFLGSWCIKLLLEAKKAAYLMDLPGASSRLKIFEDVDLLTPGAFDAAIAGCGAVLHTASPFYMAGGSEETALGPDSSAQEKLVTPAVEGTRNVLSSCHKLGVKRVALTSSTGSVYVNYGKVPADHVYSSADWSPSELFREKQNWYCLSKVLAEETAWKMSREPDCPFQLTVLLPTLIWGPMVPGQPHLNTSASSLVGYMDGSIQEIENACKTVVDVRDVARAHVEAVCREGLGGQRILLIGGSPHFEEVARYIREALPEEMKFKVPSKVSEKLGPAVMGPAPPLPVLYDVSPAEKLSPAWKDLEGGLQCSAVLAVLRLGISFKSVEEQVKSMVQSMLENGFKSVEQYAPGQM
ncbi:unnamed protein product, partial [Cladocopium goreaui]